jgi:hypothetical protein
MSPRVRKGIAPITPEQKNDKQAMAATSGVVTSFSGTPEVKYHPARAVHTPGTV